MHTALYNVVGTYMSVYSQLTGTAWWNAQPDQKEAAAQVRGRRRRSAERCRCHPRCARLVLRQHWQGPPAARGACRQACRNWWVTQPRLSQYACNQAYPTLGLPNYSGTWGPWFVYGVSGGIFYGYSEKAARAGLLQQWSAALCTQQLQPQLIAR